VTSDWSLMAGDQWLLTSEWNIVTYDWWLVTSCWDGDSYTVLPIPLRMHLPGAADLELRALYGAVSWVPPFWYLPPGPRPVAPGLHLWCCDWVVEDISELRARRSHRPDWGIWRERLADPDRASPYISPNCTALTSFLRMQALLLFLLWNVLFCLWSEVYNFCYTWCNFVILVA
jgi:hypothetical protein